MPTIAVFGAGPGLGRSIARTYGKAGHEVALVARNQDKLDALAEDLRRQGVHAHAVAGDLSDPADMPALAERIREAAGDPDVIYYAPTSADMTFVSAAELTPATIEATTSLLVTSFAALVQEFLPHMLARHRGAILTAQGATALTGTPRMSGPGPAMAAQRNYLQALGKELEGQGVYVGRAYISALITGSAIHQSLEAAGKKVPSAGLVDPDQLADRLLHMQEKGRPHEVTVPALGRAFSALASSGPGRKLMARFTS